LLHEFLIEIHPIGQDHVSKGARVLVVVVGLDGHVLPEGEFRGGGLGVVAVGLAFLRAVDAAEADAFNMVTVQYIDGVAINYSDYSSGEVGRSCIPPCEQGYTLVLLRSYPEPLGQVRFAPVGLSAASLSIGCGFCLDKLSAAQMAQRRSTLRE
jgi:hypothetical protein